jgi:transcription initiation factor TFIID subunit 5
MSMFATDAKKFLDEYKWQFERIHSDELKVLETISLPQHVLENSITKLYRSNKYALPLNNHAYHNVITFLEQNGKIGGQTITRILSTYCVVKETTRGPVDQFSFEAIINRIHSSDNPDGDLQEGIPGGFTGVSNQDLQHNNELLKLGPLTTEVDLASDVRAELEDEDTRNPPEANQLSLVEAFDEKIKREESADVVTRVEIPYPPSRARDVAMEVQKMKEYRDRFKIEGRTGGVGPAVSVCMFTFHNTLDT